jgi:hypothetical protein
MFNILNSQKDADQNCTGIPPHSVRMAIIKKKIAGGNVNECSHYENHYGGS